MNYISITYEELKNKSSQWANDILKAYTPDLVIYVAKAGFPIALELSKEMNVKMIGVETVREKVNKLKDLVAPIARKMPNFIRHILITIELKSGVHEKNSKRVVRLIDSVSEGLILNTKKILIVDDSVDTGASIVAVVDCLKDIFIGAEIKCAALNAWDKSKAMVETDFALYRNTVIKAPMSKDSKEYELFIKDYNAYLERKK